MSDQRYFKLSNGNYALYADEYNALASDSQYPNCKLVNNDAINDGDSLEVHDLSTGKIVVYAQALKGRWFER